MWQLLKVCFFVVVVFCVSFGGSPGVTKHLPWSTSHGCPKRCQAGQRQMRLGGDLGKPRRLTSDCSYLFCDAFGVDRHRSTILKTCGAPHIDTYGWVGWCSPIKLPAYPSSLPPSLPTYHYHYHPLLTSLPTQIHVDTIHCMVLHRVAPHYITLRYIA